MKRVRINKGKIGLVFKHEDFHGLVTEGTHWVSSFKKVITYDLTKPFFSTTPLDILLEHQELEERLIVLEVADNEIALRYERGIFVGILKPGRHAFWKGLIDYTFTKVNLGKVEITEPIDLHTAKRAELVPYIRVCKIESFEEGMLYVDNKFSRILKPGEHYFWKNAIALDVKKVDLRQRQMEVLGQEILTKDKAALRINFYTQYRVVNIEQAVVKNKDYEKQLYVLMQLTLREFIGKLSLDELLENRESIAQYVFESLQEKSADLGVEIKDSGVKDIIMPGEVKDIMNRVLVAQKQAQANVITRREETAATRSLLNTAKLMNENDMLFKLKEMEYVEKIAERIGEITVSGNGQIIDQLKGIFSPRN